MPLPLPVPIPSLSSDGHLRYLYALRCLRRAVDVRGNLARAADWWRARSTRVRLRILVAGVGVLGILLRDLLLIAAAGFTLLVAETLPAPKPAAQPH